MGERDLTSAEVWWWSIGKLVGALRDEWHCDYIEVFPRGPFGAFFMRKAGLMSVRVPAPLSGRAER